MGEPPHQSNTGLCPGTCLKHRQVLPRGNTLEALVSSPQNVEESPTPFPRGTNSTPGVSGEGRGRLKMWRQILSVPQGLLTKVRLRFRRTCVQSTAFSFRQIVRLSYFWSSVVGQTFCSQLWGCDWARNEDSLICSAV